MTLQPYKPLWPETAVFWGAGATAALGMSTTLQLGKVVFNLAKKEVSLQERVESAFKNKAEAKWIDSVVDLLKILGECKINCVTS